MGNEQVDVINSSEMVTNIRDLIVHLHRGNGSKAESIVAEVADKLKDIISSGLDPQSFPMQRAQQTMFAIDEVRLLLAQRDFNAAGEAARDAGKEWNQKPKSEAK
jgi:hypothetical protein